VPVRALLRRPRRIRPLAPALAAPLLLSAAVLANAAPGSATGSTAAVRTSTLPAATVVTLTGAGFGHGVGLSQYGAWGQAAEGRTAEQILSWYYRGTSVVPVADARLVRVNVAHRAARLDLSVLPVAAGGGRWRVTVGTAAPLELRATDRVGVTASDGALVVRVTRANGTSSSAGGRSVRVEWAGGGGSLASAPATVLRAGGDELRHGTLSVVPSAAAGGGPANRLEAVTSLSLHDEYLYGLAEMPSSWPREALRAQAVAARTYALRHILDSPHGTAACACDIYDTDSSQVFSGWRKESERIGGVDYGARWRAAVDATTAGPGSGLAVLGSTGRPIQAFYFSSSGGRTRNSQDVWTSALPYAVSVDDHWSTQSRNPLASWQVRLTGARVAGAFGLRSLAALSVTGRDASGAVTRAQAKDTSGVVRTLSGETFRSRLGLCSAWVRSVALTVPASTPSSATPATAAH
jgi:SpoIID/LytB domain protein